MHVGRFGTTIGTLHSLTLACFGHVAWQITRIQQIQASIAWGADVGDPRTPWERASQTRRSRRSEDQGAKLENGRRVARSGAGREKGDIRANGFRIEDKFTDSASYTITVETLRKITREALQTPPGLLPQMRITFAKHGQKWRMLREEDYMYLVAQAALDG